MVYVLLTGCTDMTKGGIPGLGLTDEDVDLLRGVDCDILVQGLIELIEYSYVPDLGLTAKDVGLLRTVDCDILAQDLIGLIEYSYVPGLGLTDGDVGLLRGGG
jgi:hypothetical protein